jgi:hypothetical protein
MIIVAAIAAVSLLAVLALLRVTYNNYAKKVAARNRPTYDGNVHSPLYLWLRNCDKSLEWSKKRRSNG